MWNKLRKYETEADAENEAATFIHHDLRVKPMIDALTGKPEFWFIEERFSRFVLVETPGGKLDFEWAWW